MILPIELQLHEVNSIPYQFLISTNIHMAYGMDHLIGTQKLYTYVDMPLLYSFVSLPMDTVK